MSQTPISDVYIASTHVVPKCYESSTEAQDGDGELFCQLTYEVQLVYTLHLALLYLLFSFTYVRSR